MSSQPIALIALIALSLSLTGCVRDNGDASFGPVTDAQYREALTNGNARTR